MNNKTRNILRLKLINKALIKLFWFYNDIKWFFLDSSTLGIDINDQTQFTIGITTFKDRFEISFKPLLKKLVKSFPVNEIIVIANGHYKREEQLRYLKKIKEYRKSFNNVKLISFIEPKGLSFLWNEIINNAENSKILILNDDLNISIEFRLFILNSGIINMHISTINKSWSHFFISKDITDKVGLFDENFVEIGGEDDDYAARLAIAGINISNFNSDTICSKGRKRLKQIKTNSYGKVIALQRGGYSTLNTEYLESKWIMSEKYFEGSIFVPNRKYSYWKLRE